MRSKTPRKDTAISERRALIAKFYLQGWYQWDIAKEIGCDQATVSRNLDAIRKQWKDAAIRDFDEAKEKELAKIDVLEQTYWESWMRSLTEKETTSTKRTKKELQTSDEASIKKERRDGNPEFLKGVQWCITKRCEILGFNAPIKSEQKRDYCSLDDFYEATKRGASKADEYRNSKSNNSK